MPLNAVTPWYKEIKYHRFLMLNYGLPKKSLTREKSILFLWLSIFSTRRFIKITANSLQPIEIPPPHMNSIGGILDKKRRLTMATVVGVFMVSCVPQTVVNDTNTPRARNLVKCLRVGQIQRTGTESRN